jgi:adenylate cyclase
VRIVAGGDHCPPPAQDELDTLNRIHAPEGTRLACQLRPQGNVTVIPLLVAMPSRLREPANEAVEREIAVMLVTFRWTATPHSVLPQDLLYLLNRYSEIVGDTVRKEGGVPIQFLGDCVTGGHGSRTNRAALACLGRSTRAGAGLDGRLRHPSAHGAGRRR